MDMDFSEGKNHSEPLRLYCLRARQRVPNTSSQCIQHLARSSPRKPKPSSPRWCACYTLHLCSSTTFRITHSWGEDDLWLTTFSVLHRPSTLATTFIPCPERIAKTQQPPQRPWTFTQRKCSTCTEAKVWTSTGAIPWPAHRGRLSRDGLEQDWWSLPPCRQTDAISIPHVIWLLATSRASRSGFPDCRRLQELGQPRLHPKEGSMRGLDRRQILLPCHPQHTIKPRQPRTPPHPCSASHRCRHQEVRCSIHREHGQSGVHQGARVDINCQAKEEGRRHWRRIGQEQGNSHATGQVGLEVNLTERRRLTSRVRATDGRVYGHIKEGHWGHIVQLCGLLILRALGCDIQTRFVS